MGNGFTVRADGLAAGGKDVAGLLAAGEKTGSGAVSAISGMGGAASGHAGLAAALLSAAEKGTKAFLDIGAAYEHTSTSLAATAASYGQAEAENAAKAHAIVRRAR
jgi:hypothetical protein